MSWWNNVINSWVGSNVTHIANATDNDIVVEKSERQSTKFTITIKLTI